MKIHKEKGHFLSKEKKEIKQKIMEKLVDAIPDTIKEAFKTGVDFNGQELADITLSCIIMFCRDALLKQIEFMGMHPKVIPNYLDEVFGTIKSEVIQELEIIDKTKH